MGDSPKNTIIVSTLGGDVVVRRLALGDYAALLRALKQLPAKFGQFLGNTDDKELTKMGLEEFLPLVPELIADSLPEFAELLAVASDKEAKFFLEGDLADAIDVLVAALELNDYKRVASSIKKLMPQKPAELEA